MDYIRFYLSNKRLISLCFALTLFSSFGQTFLISLYVPGIMKEFGLDTFRFGIIYGAATISSGIALAYAGKFVDSWNLRNYTIMAVVILIASCLLIAISGKIVFIFLGFLGLRLAGPGLFAHISSTSISKLFEKTRGMGLSLAALGYSAGEAFLPITIIALISLIGWRNSMLLNAAAALTILLPIVFLTLNEKLTRLYSEKSLTFRTSCLTKSLLWKDKRFYIIALNTIILPAVVTGLFFYQFLLAEEKGWTIKLLSGSFIGYAAGKTLFSLISGKLIDRFSALSLFPVYLIPFAGALCLLALFKNNIVAPIYLILTGVSAGLSSTVNTALLAEIYGTEDLGAVRSVFASVTVLSTALSPALFGILLKIGLPFTFINCGAACVVSGIVIISGRLRHTAAPLAEKN